MKLCHAVQLNPSFGISRLLFTVSEKIFINADFRTVKPGETKTRKIFRKFFKNNFSTLSFLCCAYAAAEALQ
jgi:hypothetical protein